MPAEDYDITNEQLVAAAGDGTIIVMIPARRMTKQKALVHAAWLVALADDEDEFKDILAKVQGT